MVAYILGGKALQLASNPLVAWRTISALLIPPFCIAVRPSPVRTPDGIRISNSICCLQALLISRLLRSESSCF
jgi:hypothetical protein